MYLAATITNEFLQIMLKWMVRVWVALHCEEMIADTHLSCKWVQVSVYLVRCQRLSPSLLGDLMLHTLVLPRGEHCLALWLSIASSEKGEIYEILKRKKKALTVLVGVAEYMSNLHVACIHKLHINLQHLNNQTECYCSNCSWYLRRSMSLTHCWLMEMYSGE